MAVNEVVYNGKTLINLTDDTVTPTTLAAGATAHDASGEKIVGTMPIETVLYTKQTLTEAQKAQARENIGATAGEEVEFADSVEWLNENGDTSKKYVLPDGYIYAWQEKYVSEKHNANNSNAWLNKRPKITESTNTYNDSVTQVGVLTSDVIPFATDWVNANSANRSISTVTISGLDKLVPVYNSSVIVYYYKKDGTKINAMLSAQLASLGDSNSSDITLPISFYLKDSNFSATSWSNVGYVKIQVGISKDGNITAEDVKGLSINVPYYDYEGVVSGWYSTGQQHSNDKATQQNSADILALKERITTLETESEELREMVENADVINISTGQVLYAVGDSITYGYGIGGNEYSWVKTVIDRNGYASYADGSKNLGQSGLGFCTTSTSGGTINTVVGGTNFSGADIVTVALGINDWKNPNATLTQFFEGMEYCFNKIRTDNPYCKIFYILPFNARFLGTFDTFYCLGATGDSNKDRPYAHTLQAFVNMIKAKFEEDTFKAFNVNVIDMVECPSINRHNITTALIDSIHPSAETNIELGKEISRRIALT
jgi:lysophospholipase L1-like esterase